MKAIVLFLSLLPLVASADYIARCNPPVTKSADDAAKGVAAAVVRHLTNIEQIRAGVEPAKRILPTFGEAESIDIIAGHSRMCYQFFRPGSHICDYSVPPSASPYDKPAVCVWSKLTAAQQAKVRALGVGP